MSQNTTTNMAIFYGLLAAFIWGAWPVITTLGLKYAMTPYEAVIFRVSLMGPLFAIVAFKGNNTLHYWLKAFIMSFMSGAPYIFVSSSGFLYSSASHGGVIIPGTFMLASVLMGYFFLQEKLTPGKIVGVTIIVTGLVMLVVGIDVSSPETSSSLLGDSIFLLAGVMWALYTMLLKLWNLDPLQTVARVAFLSFVGTAIYHVLFSPELHFADMPTANLVGQFVYQGIFAAFAILIFSKAVAVLGASRTGILNAIIPVISIVLAILILKEIPTVFESIGLVAIVGGIILAMRGPGKRPQVAEAKP